MNLCLWFFAGAGLVVSFACRVEAATFEVAQRNPHADDNGPGSVERPWKTIGKAAHTAVAGDVVVIRDGVYREHVVVRNNGTPQGWIRFEAASGAHVLLTGADRLAHWEKDEDGQPVYHVSWPHRFVGWSKNMTHPGDDYHRLIGRCEQVAIEGYLLRQVLQAEQLAPGTFFADVSNAVLHVWDSGNRDLNKLLVEGSVRPEVLRIEGAYVLVRGLQFRFAANMAQHGAVVLAGAHDSLEDCVVADMNSSGATLAAEKLIVRRCVFRDNGQLGFGANGAHDLQFTDCLVENNNTKGFDRGWEAGGDKLVLCRNAVLERSRFVRNRGNGIWFDIGNEHCTVRQCYIADNEDSGIFYEISFGLQAHDNVIVGNGFAETRGAWGAQAGISLSSSPDCVVERNLIVGNREGFDFREQQRTTPRIGSRGEVAVWNHDEIIRHNIIACNRDAQVWGWFDTTDDRCWPAAMRPEPTPASTLSKPEDIAAAYAAKDAKKQPQGLTLEKLQLRFEDNDYFAPAGQGSFEWGASWRRHKSYPNLGVFQKELAIDVRGDVLDPGFADPQALDYRLKPEMMRRFGRNCPQGPVPGAVLGVQP